MDYILEKPLDFIVGLFKKLWLYLWYFDIPQAESIQIQGEFSPIFKFPLPGFAFILIFGSIGIWRCNFDENTKILLTLLIASVLGVIIFFVIGRFRLISAIPLIIFAAYGLKLSYQALMNKNKRILIKLPIMVVIVIVLLYLPRHIDKTYKIASAYDNVGIFHYLTKNKNLSEKWYREAIEIYPGHDKALNNLGALFYYKHDADSAVYYINQAIKANSNSSRAHLNLGHIYMDRKDYEKARYHFEKAKSLAPYGLDADNALAELNMILSESSISQITDSLSSFTVFFNLAEKKAAQQVYGEAEIYYKKALEYKPDDLKCLNNLGFIYQAQKNFKSASEIFTKTIELYGDNAIAFNNLASTLFQMGNIDSSIALWEKAIELNPRNPQWKKNLNYARQFQK
jgi:tetratricopeptide (TPR) repeat protein